MENLTKEVYFASYCYKCKYAETPESEEPCSECLDQPWNENSHRPIRFELDKEREKRESGKDFRIKSCC